jgi:hypothetical protein
MLSQQFHSLVISLLQLKFFTEFWQMTTVYINGYKVILWYYTTVYVCVYIYIYLQCAIIKSSYHLKF